MVIQAGARTRRRRREISMALQSRRRDTELLCSPGKYQGGSVQLFFGDRFLVEVSLADDEEVSGRVVAGGGVADETWVPKLINVAVAVDAVVVGDVDPAL